MLSHRHLRRSCPIALGVCVSSLLISAAVPAALAQSSVAPSRHLSAPNPSAMGSFSGTVVDPTGAVIPGASITVTPSGANSNPITATSDSAGDFTIPGLRP